MGHYCPRVGHTLTHTAGKKPTVFGRPGGDGAGHANDPSLDIWGGAGLAIRTAGGSFSDPNGSDSTRTQKIFEILLVQNRSAGMHSIKFKTNAILLCIVLNVELKKHQGDKPKRTGS